jgi:Domain of unknown function (DUF222)
LTANTCSCSVSGTSHCFPSSFARAGGSGFGKVRGAVEALKSTARALDPARIDGHDAAALFDAVSEGERVCSAMKALLARRIEETKVWREAGHRSAAHWVAEATGETVGAAARTLETARALEQLPETDAAFRSGRLSPTQAAEITSAAGADPAAESDLLDAAGSTSVKGLKDRCRQVRAGAEADDHTWARRLHLGRRAHDWNDPEGFYRFEGRMAPDAGARFSSAWQAHIDRVFRDARRAGRHEPRAAYAADALFALATEGPCKPVEVRVTVDSSALARGHRARGALRDRPRRSGARHHGPGDARRRIRRRAGARRRRHHGRHEPEAGDPGEAAPRARGPLPDVWRQELCQRPVPADRPRRAVGGRR